MLAPVPDSDSLLEAFSRQRTAFERDGGLSPEARRAGLRTLRTVIKARSDDFAKTVAADFGGRSRHETLIAEIGVLLGAIDHALPRLARWAKPERVAVGWRFWPARGRIMKQPLGVVGVLAPWNYPVQLALMPVVAALAAGCRTLVKPSELTPATAALLADTLADSFAPEVLAAVTGGPEVAARMSRLPFDALIFTGSGRVGRQVMAAAADNLTPVVLELGGKCPAIVDETADLDDGGGVDHGRQASQCRPDLRRARLRSGAAPAPAELRRGVPRRRQPPLPRSRRPRLQRDPRRGRSPALDPIAGRAADGAAVPWHARGAEARSRRHHRSAGSLRRDAGRDLRSAPADHLLRHPR